MTSMFSILTTLKKHKLTMIISLIFFIIPFFWLKGEEMDLGGDSSRLFFYDPINYIKSTSLYGVSTVGKGAIISFYFNIPYVGLIALLKFFLISPTLVINTVNGIKLAASFMAIYLIVYEFLKNVYFAKTKYEYWASILAGIFYVVSLGSIHMADSWRTALPTHNEIFLHPLIFYLLFKLFLTKRFIYLWIGLLVSFVFAPNFSYGTSPSFFAFYPIAFVFLCIYIKFFSKKTIPLIGIGIGLLFFFGIHSFHLVSQLSNLFDSGSGINTRVFNKSQAIRDGLQYFTAVSLSGMASLNLLLPPLNAAFRFLAFIAPLILIIGFILNKKKEFLLISLFFMLTFFLVTANITNIGYEFYKNLFYIPMFGMFRVFYVKWMAIFLFFYAILFGFASYNIFFRLKLYYAKLLFFLIFIFLIITGIPLFSGELVNMNVRGSSLKLSIVMDPAYGQTLQFVRGLPDDGKILVLPVTDFYLQVIYGKNGGAYVGPSTFNQLTSKYSFSGDRDFGWDTNDPAPYSETIMKYAREKDYARLLSIFTTLNIRYIFHNEDPKIYEESFTRFEGPYAYIKSSFPPTQGEYKDFIRRFPVNEIYKNGPYTIYEIDKSVYNSTIFIPDGIYESNKLSFDKEKFHSVFIDSKTCDREEFKNICRVGYKASGANLNLKMVNPALYAVTVRQHEKVDPMLLVMQHTYHREWKLIIDGKQIPENRHVSVNGYANAWLLFEKDLPKKEEYTLLITLDQQKYFWYGLTITAVSLICVIVLLLYSLFSKK